MQTVAVLFARSDSHYKTMPGADVWDIERDARRWPGGAPVVAHPPCRAWGRLRQFAKPIPGEKELAFDAVKAVQLYGGVLEHPEHSTLWKDAGLPPPGAQQDKFGGWTYPVDQFWFGHLARKRTWLYIVGALPAELPPIPLVLGQPSHVVRYDNNVRRKQLGLKILSHADREHTPPAFGAWLLDVARLCSREGVPC